MQQHVDNIAILKCAVMKIMQLPDVHNVTIKEKLKRTALRVDKNEFYRVMYSKNSLATVAPC